MRLTDSKGRLSYSGEGLSLASFRESSELEFGADDAFILTDGRFTGWIETGMNVYRVHPLAKPPD